MPKIIPHGEKYIINKNKEDISFLQAIFIELPMDYDYTGKWEKILKHLGYPNKTELVHIFPCIGELETILEKLLSIID